MRAGKRRCLDSSDEEQGSVAPSEDDIASDEDVFATLTQEPIDISDSDDDFVAVRSVRPTRGPARAPPSAVAASKSAAPAVAGSGPSSEALNAPLTAEERALSLIDLGLRKVFGLRAFRGQQRVKRWG